MLQKVKDVITNKKLPKLKGLVMNMLPKLKNLILNVAKAKGCSYEQEVARAKGLNYEYVAKAKGLQYKCDVTFCCFCRS